MPAGELLNSGSIKSEGSLEHPDYLGESCLVTHDTGSLDLVSGQLTLGGTFGLETGSSVTGASAAELVFDGDVTSTVASVGSIGSVYIGDTFKSEHALSLPKTVISGTYEGPGNLAASPSLKVQGGRLAGSGVVTIGSGKTLLLEDGQLESGELVNEGATTIAGSSDFPGSSVGAGAKFVNTGSLTLAAGSYFSGGCEKPAREEPAEPAVPAGEFVDSGSIKSEGSLEHPVYFGESCLVTYDTGSLDLVGGQLTLGGTFGLETGSSVTGASAAELVFDGDVTSTLASVGSIGSVYVGGTFKSEHALSLPKTVISGTYEGPGNLTPSPSLKVQDGRLAGSGVVTIASGKTLVLEYAALESGELVNEGAATIAGGYDYPLNNVAAGAKFVNTGSLTLAAGSYFSGGCEKPAREEPAEPAVPAGEFVDSGSIKSEGSFEHPDYFGESCLVTHDTGSLDVVGGQLTLGGTFGLESGSSVTGASTAELVFDGNVTSTLASVGSVGSVYIGGTFKSEHALPLPKTVISGTYEGPGNLTAAPSLKVQGGRLAGSGVVTVGVGKTLLLEYAALESGELLNEGAATIAGGYDYPLNNVAAGAKFVNTGSLTLAAGSYFSGGCEKPAREEPAEPAVPAGEFVDSGSIKSEGSFEHPDYFGESCLVTHDTGSLDVAGGQLTLGGTFGLETGSSVTGAAAAELVFSGDVTSTLATVGSIGSVEIGGTFKSEHAFSLPKTVISGTYEGPGNLTASPSLKVQGGRLAGSGVVTVGVGKTLVLEYAALESGELLNEGAATIAGGYDYPLNNVAAGAKFVNTGSLTLAAGSYFSGGCEKPAREEPAEPAVPAGEFVNSGSIKSEGSFEHPDYFGESCLVTRDSGPLDVNGGQLTLGGTFGLETGSSVTGASAAELIFGGDVTSTLASVGSIGKVAVDGHVHATHSLSLPDTTFDGTLEISPGVVVSAASATTIDGSIELDGTGGFGHLSVGGSVDLDEPSLYFSSLEYVPPCGATITAVTAGGLAGGFDYVSGGNSLSEGSWEPEATSTTAGGYRYCPPPPTPAAETYGAGGSYDSYNPSGYAAEPVNTATGAYNTTETDASMPGLGVAFNFTRSYTSSNPYDGPLGTGWTDSLNVLIKTEGSNAVLYSEDGQQTTFTPNGEGGYTGGPGTRSVLTTKPGGGWVLTRQNGEKLTFNEEGQLLTKEDRNGDGLTLTYNGEGKLATAKDYAGREVKFTYNGAGLLASMQLPLSREVKYAYNSSNQLTKVTDAEGGTTEYEYNAQGLLESVTNQDGHRIVDNTYEGSGRVAEQTNALGKTAKFSYAEGETTYTDPNGGQWKYVYDGDVLVEEINPTGAVTKYAYNADLDRTAVTDANGNTTTMTYNSAGDMLTKTAPLGGEQTWTYDALNDVTSYVDGDGHKTTYTYNSAGDLLTTTYANGATQTQTYEGNGALATSTDAEGNKTTYAYNTQGELTSITSPLGEKTTYAYDGAGRLTSATSPRGNEKGAEPSKFTTTYTYNAQNRVLTATDGEGHDTKYTYDKVGNKTSETTPEGDTTTYTYNTQNELTGVSDAEGATTTYGYDNNGNRTSKTTPDGGKTTYTFNGDNELTKVTDPLEKSTTYSYDGDGNKTKIVDATGAITTLAYNADDELASESYSDGTPTVSYEYDAAGNKTQIVDGTGTTVYTFNELNDLAAVNGPNGDYSYAYNKDGRVTSRAYPDGSTTTYAYDADGRLASVITSGGTTTYAYNAASQVKEEKMPNGYAETTAYTDSGLVASVADANAKGTLTSYAYAYNGDGQPTTVATAAGTITYGYNKDGRLTSACYGTSCASGTYTYSYNADGDRTKLVATAGTTTYGYNEADQLESTEGPGGKTTYSYDADGRRTAVGATTYTWNAANELTAVKSSSSTTTYAYEGAGNRISATTGGVTTTYGYDVNNTVPKLVLEKQGSSELRRYSWGNDLVSMNAGGNEYYVAHEAQGSVVAVTSTSGATEDTIEYEPFGGVLSETPAKGAPPITLKYNAELLEPSGLYHTPARELDPATGAFLSRDPLMQPLAQPAISPYIYVDDQPTVLADPTGESSEGGIASYEAEINELYAYGMHEAGVFQEVSNGNDTASSGVEDITEDAVTDEITSDDVPDVIDMFF